MHLSSHLFRKHYLSIHCAPDTMTGHGNIDGSETGLLLSMNRQTADNQDFKCAVSYQALDA